MTSTGGSEDHGAAQGSTAGVRRSGSVMRVRPSMRRTRALSSAADRTRSSASRAETTPRPSSTAPRRAAEPAKKAAHSCSSGATTGSNSQRFRGPLLARMPINCGPRIARTAAAARSVAAPTARYKRRRGLDVRFLTGTMTMRQPSILRFRAWTDRDEMVGCEMTAFPLTAADGQSTHIVGGIFPFHQPTLAHDGLARFELSAARHIWIENLPVEVAGPRKPASPRRVLHVIAGGRS